MTKETARPIARWMPIQTIAAIALAWPVAAAAGGDADKGLAQAERWCNSCHSIGDEEPRQEDAGPLFTELAKKDADYLKVAINRPHDFMPKFPKLSDADKDDLIAYIQSLK